MAYVLATTENRVRWYVFPIKSLENIKALQVGDFELVEQLDLSIVPGFGNKDTAKKVAMLVGLKTWRYVKIDTPVHTYTFV